MRQTKSCTNSTVEGSTSSELSVDAGPIEYWRKKYTWPKRYFDQDLESSEPLARNRSSSIRSQEVQSSQGTLIELSRDAKSAPYNQVRYETYLAAAGAFMDIPPLKITDVDGSLCQQLLGNDQCTPTCSKIRNETKARIIKDITW